MENFKYWMIEYDSMLYPEYKYTTEAIYKYQGALDEFNKSLPDNCFSSKLIEYEISEKVIDSKARQGDDLWRTK